MAFTLHPQLDKDCAIIGDLPLCRVLLMNNSHFPWLILVPMRDAMRELHELADADYALAMHEIRLISSKFSTYCNADKMNVAALGNMVPQLHIHIIARYKTDPAWPGPVWNSHVSTQPYTADSLDLKCMELKQHLELK